MSFWGVFHGVSWKAVALLSKLGFLVLVAPRLVQGEFGQYLFIISWTQLASKFIACGAEDQLPLVIHQNKTPGDFSKIGLLAFFFSFILLLLHLKYPHSFILLVATIFSFFGATYISGLVRSFSPNSFEHLHNAPGIVFFFVSLTKNSWSAQELIRLQASSNLIVACIVVAWHFKILMPNAKSSIFDYFVQSAQAGFQKMLTSFAQLFIMRGFIVMPPLMGFPSSDALAFAASIAEGFWQVLLVMTSRNYVRYVKEGRSIGQKIFTYSSLFYLGVTLITGSLLMILAKMNFSYTLNGKIDYLLSSGMVLFYGSLIPLMEARYLDWAEHRSKYFYTIISLFMVLPLLLTILLVPMANWTICFGALCFFLSTIFLVIKINSFKVI